MSLVNEVIEELKRRQASGEHVPASMLAECESDRFGAPLASPSRRSAKTTALLAFGLAGVAVLLLEAATQWSAIVKPVARTAAVSARPPQADIAPVPEQAAAHGWFEPQLAEDDLAELHDVEVRLEDGYTRAFFRLTSEREYWVQGDPALGEIEIVIGGTRLATAFAPFAFQGTGVILREAHNSSQGLHLLLSFEPAARVQSQVVYDDEGPALVVDVIDGRERAAAAPEPLIRVEPSHGAALERTGRREDGWGVISHKRPGAGAEPLDAFASYERGQRLDARGRRDEAMAEYVRALSIDPALHPAREALVILLIEAEKYDAANRHLEEAAARAPGHGEYNFLKARLLVATQQDDRAIAILESLPVPPERRSDAVNLLAALYQKRGDHGRAESLFRHAVQLAPHEARLWMGLGISLEGQQREAEALAVYKQADSLARFETGPRRWLRSRIRELSSLE